MPIDKKNIFASSARSQIFINLVFTFVKSLSLILAIRFADVLLSASTMGLALLFRRQGALWGNLLQLGLSQSLKKFYTSNPDSTERSLVWAILSKWVIVAGLSAVVVAVIYSEGISEALLGQRGNLLSIAFSLYISGVALGYMACSSWQVEFNFVQSNIIDWLNGSLVFIFCIFIGTYCSDTIFIFWLGALTFISSGASFLWFGYRYAYLSTLIKNSWKVETPVLCFSLTRGATAFGDMGTITLGPWLLKDSPVQAGYLIIAYTVLRMAQALIMPVAQVLSLRANSYRHDQVAEERRVFILALLSFIGGWVAVAAYYTMGEFFISLWLPNSDNQVISILDELMLFTPAVCLFYSLRNYIDLRYVTPWNLIVFVLSLIGFFCGYCSVTSGGLEAVVFGSKIMFTTLMMSGLNFSVFYFLRLKLRK